MNMNMNSKGNKRRRVETANGHGHSTSSTLINGTTTTLSRAAETRWNSDLPACVAVLQKPRRPSSPRSLLQLAQQLTDAVFADAYRQRTHHHHHHHHHHHLYVESPSASGDSGSLERALSRVGANVNVNNSNNENIDSNNLQNASVGAGVIEESVLDGGAAEDEHDEDEDDEDFQFDEADDDIQAHVIDSDDDADQHDTDEIQTVPNNNNNNNKQNKRINLNVSKVNNNLSQQQQQQQQQQQHQQENGKQQSTNGRKRKLQSTSPKQQQQQQQQRQQQQASPTAILANGQKQRRKHLPWWRSSRTRVSISDRPDNENELLRGYVSAVARACMLESYAKDSLRNSYDRDAGSPCGEAFRTVSTSLLLMERARHMAQAQVQFGPDIMHSLLQCGDLRWDFLIHNNNNNGNNNNNNTAAATTNTKTEKNDNHNNDKDNNHSNNGKKIISNSRKKMSTSGRNRPNQTNSDTFDFIGCEVCGRYRPARYRVLLSQTQDCKVKMTNGNSNVGVNGLTNNRNGEETDGGGVLGSDGRDWWPRPMRLHILSRKREPMTNNNNTNGNLGNSGSNINGGGVGKSSDVWYSVTVEVDHNNTNSNTMTTTPSPSPSPPSGSTKNKNNNDSNNNNNSSTCNNLPGIIDEVLVDEQCLRKLIVFHRLVHATRRVTEAVHATVEDELRDGVMRVRLQSSSSASMHDAVRTTLSNILCEGGMGNGNNNIDDDEEDDDDDILIPREAQQLSQLLRLGDLYFSGKHEEIIESGFGLENIDDPAPGIHDNPLYLADEDYDHVVKQVLAQHRIIQG